MLNTIRWFVIAMMFALLGNVASAVISDEDAIEHLVIGDEYTIVAKRNDVEERFVGELVKANDRWIVLYQLTECRNEFSVPVLSKVPYVNRLFKNVGIGREKHYLWIPREVATIQGRVRATNRSTTSTPPDELPTLKDHCYIQYTEKGNSALASGNLEKITDDQMTVIQHRFENSTTGVPYIMDVPYLGALFRKTVDREHDVNQQVPLHDVLCVRVSYNDPLDSENTSIESKEQD